MEEIEELSKGKRNRISHGQCPCGRVKFPPPLTKKQSKTLHYTKKVYTSLAMSFFRTLPPSASTKTNRPTEFSHLPADVCYMDSACQTPRIQAVIEAEQEYVLHHNACGGRVQYKWGKWVDERVQGARKEILALCGKTEKEYAVAFTLNTTYGINLVLHQLPADAYDRIVTSTIEHNSVFLPALTWAKRNHKERLVLQRSPDGSLAYEQTLLSKTIVLLNNASNIDGRTLPNAQQLTNDVHAQGGILLLDAAQSCGHDPRSLQETNFDAAFGSGHKMYGPSVGFIVIRRTLLRSLQPFFLGGGTAENVEQDAFRLFSGEDEHAVLEPGLQNWSGIIGLREAARWLQTQNIADQEHLLAEALFQRVRDIPKITVVNGKPGSILSLYADGIDAHRLALYLDEKNVMCRSGHFCCHYELQHQRNLPPLLRASLGLHNTMEDIEKFVKTLETIVKAM